MIQDDDPDAAAQAEHERLEGNRDEVLELMSMSPGEQLIQIRKILDCPNNEHIVTHCKKLREEIIGLGRIGGVIK